MNMRHDINIETKDAITADMVLICPAYNSFCSCCLSVTEAPMDLYSVLGVEQNASIEKIKQSYHRLVLQYHPDRNHQKEKQKKDNVSFLQIQEAWEILRDEDKRRLYDEELNKLKLKESNVSISYQTTLNDLELIDDEKDENGKIINFYEYPCRCGDYFEIEIDANSINTDKSNSTSVITSCPTCCLNLKLVY